MRILVTGITGFVGGALAPRLLRDGHEIRGLSRDPSKSRNGEVEVLRGDAISGEGLPAALDGVQVAYYLIHSMETPSVNDAGGFDERDRRAAETFAAVAAAAGVERIVYLGGLVPRSSARSAHLRSRLEVERTLLGAVPGAVALRASIVIGARSRSFRFLVRLIERLPVIALPPWRDRRTQPIDGRDVVEILARAGTDPGVAGRSLDMVGPETLSYGRMIERIRDQMLVSRPSVDLGLTATPIASRIAAAIAGEEHELVGPLMESLEHDLLSRERQAGGLLGVRLHSFDAAVERALRDWENVEELRAR